MILPRAILRFLAFAVTFLYVPISHAQSQPSTAPPSEFEAASIRMVPPLSENELRQGLGNVPWSTFPTNRFTGHRITLEILVSLAYGINADYIQSGPDWLNSQQYSIEAKVEGDHELSYEQMQPLLQHLLEQRFHLVTHRNTRLTPGFALLVAKGGPKLTTAKEAVTPHGQILSNGLQIYNVDTEHFVQMLTSPAGGPVVDRTGIQGNYDFKLSYAPANDPASSLPSLFTALQEQLGLRLESQKVPVEFLVIDRVDRTPTEN